MKKVPSYSLLDDGASVPSGGGPHIVPSGEVHNVSAGTPRPADYPTPSSATTGCPPGHSLKPGTGLVS